MSRYRLGKTLGNALVKPHGLDQVTPIQPTQEKNHHISSFAGWAPLDLHWRANKICQQPIAPMLSSCSDKEHKDTHCTVYQRTVYEIIHRSPSNADPIGNHPGRLRNAYVYLVPT